jgi:hypothetical protein
LPFPLPDTHSEYGDKNGNKSARKAKAMIASATTAFVVRSGMRPARLDRYFHGTLFAQRFQRTFIVREKPLFQGLKRILSRA